MFRHWYQYDNFLKAEEKETFIKQFKANDSRKNTRTMFNVLCSFYSFEPEKDDFYFKPENLELLYKLNVFIGFWFNIALQHPTIMLKNIDESILIPDISILTNKTLNILETLLVKHRAEEVEMERTSWRVKKKPKRVENIKLIGL